MKTPTKTKTLMILMVACTAMALHPSSSSAAEPGIVDRHFGANGVRVMDFGPPKSVDHMVDLVVQRSGKSVQILNLTYKSGNVDIVVSRLRSSGLVDRTFGRNGVTRLRIGRSSGKRSEVAMAAAVDRKDRIVISAKHVVRRSKKSRVERLMLIRLTKNGTPDQSFGSGGRSITSLSGDNAKVGGFGRIAIDSRARPLVALVLRDRRTNDDFAVARFTRSGSLDRGFGRRGVSRIALGTSSEDELKAITLTKDGAILLGGQTNDRKSKYSAAVLGKLRPSGSRDRSFGKNGIIEYKLGDGRANSQYGNEIDAIRVLPNGKIVAVGAKVVSKRRIDTFAVAMRFEADGSLDQSFGVGGVSTDSVTDPTTAYTTVLRFIEVGADGSIYAAGALTGHDTLGDYWDYGCLVTKFTPQGGVDREFGRNGLACLHERAGLTKRYELKEFSDGSAIALVPDGLLYGATIGLSTAEKDAMVLKFGM